MCQIHRFLEAGIHPVDIEEHLRVRRQYRSAICGNGTRGVCATGALCARRRESVRDHVAGMDHQRWRPVRPGNGDVEIVLRKLSRRNIDRTVRLVIFTGDGDVTEGFTLRRTGAIILSARPTAGSQKTKDVIGAIESLVRRVLQCCGRQRLGAGVASQTSENVCVLWRPLSKCSEGPAAGDAKVCESVAIGQIAGSERCSGPAKARNWIGLSGYLAQVGAQPTLISANSEWHLRVLQRLNIVLVGCWRRGRHVVCLGLPPRKGWSGAPIQQSSGRNNKAEGF